MELQFILQSTIDRNPNHVNEYESIYGHDDDAFYTELERQILLLTADEDEDFTVNKNNSSSSSTYRRGWSCRLTENVSSPVQPAASYFSWGANENPDSVPTWLVNLWRKSNGTGVFIPRIVNSRTRRTRPGRINNEMKMYKQALSSKEVLPYARN